MTDLESELEAQAAWRLRPQFRHLKIFETLARNEFLDAEEEERREQRALRQMLEFAVARVPYYRDLFEETGLRVADIRSPKDLPRLPLLSKLMVNELGRRLHAEQLPKGEKVFGFFSSSGTTGRPAKVLHSQHSNMMFPILGQRHVRWSRWDPMRKVAEIRLPSQMPLDSENQMLRPGETRRLNKWRYLGQFFETGPYAGFSVFNPLEDQLAWLDEEQPAYLSGYSETLEQLAFGRGDRPPPPSLRGVRAISEQLTDAMRQRITGAFDVPISQNYGLNEVGIVASGCAAGRYHVNTEHCLVEIIDLDGQPAAVGTSGRIVVTALSNRAMPLIRYDTDDMAMVVEGPCPCGRSLPSFGGIVGRYSRIAYLPEGTLGYVGALREALETMPQELVRNLRQFQVHQYRDGRFQMRLRTVGALPEALKERLHRAWRRSVGDDPWTLELIEVAEIERPPSGKYQDFTSDFVPGLDSDAVPDPSMTGGGS